MTTNSPNPVYGDVQALIKDCQRDIEKLEKSLASNNDHPMSFSEKHLRSELARQQVALAALTAEPETPACFVTYWPDTDEESDRPHSESDESCARRIAGEIGGYVRPCFIVDDGEKLYTTPPAQLLRPVELPEFKVHSNQPCWPSLTVGLRDREWIEALRQQGYEVKE